LTYKEFEEAFNHLTYELQPNDIQTMITLADENEAGLIPWE